MTFIRDPCGIVCVIVTYLAIFYADYVVTRWIIILTMQNSLWGPIHVVGFNTIIFMLALAHLKAVLSDPGTVPLPQMRLDFSDYHANGNGQDSDEWTVCMRCETYRPPRAHHCRICKRCVRRMDHHCPWINNCVGERNQKYFLQFLVYVGALAIYSMGLVIGSWIYPCDTCSIDLPESQARMLHSVLLLLESALFGLFVVAIMVDQIHAILYEDANNDVMPVKGMPRPYKQSKLMLLSDVCGRTHPILWLFPCTTMSNNKFYDTPLLSHDV